MPHTLASETKECSRWFGVGEFYRETGRYSHIGFPIDECVTCPDCKGAGYFCTLCEQNTAACECEPEPGDERMDDSVRDYSSGLAGPR